MQPAANNHILKMFLKSYFSHTILVPSGARDCVYIMVHL